MAVGEIFLSAFVTVLFRTLASGQLLKLLSIDGIDDKIKKWKRHLTMIEAVLSDAEERQIADKAIHLWLEDLQDLAYDMDDVLDELITEVSRRDHRQPESSSIRKVRKLIPSCCTSFTPSAIRASYKIEGITERLDALTKRNDALKLMESSSGKLNRAGQGSGSTSSVVEESSVLGREEDKAAICKLLLEGRTRNHDGQGREVCVIPIFGMGGLGKTTLAQLVYNDKQVKVRFNHRAWVCVGEDFDLLKISNLIYDSVAKASKEFKNLNSVQVGLKEKLTNKKFLVVLDDVWDENYEKWEQFKVPFLVGAPESAIIVTTRNGKVVEKMGSMEAYALKLLPDSECISLLAQHSLRIPNFEMHPMLKKTGEEIARKCRGLPLAAKSLGGVLRSNTSLKYWQKISTSEIWDLPGNGILPALRLSYHHLPPHLKRLFVYCSIFPKDFEFRKDDLILLWMAEGLLTQTKENMQMEDLGLEYFNELVSRTFLSNTQSRNDEEEPRFLMHDLFNDLAMIVAGNLCVRLDEKVETNKEHSSFSEKVRHSSFIQQQYGTCIKFEPYFGSLHLRTFLPIAAGFSGYSYLSNTVINKLLPKLRFLRVLSLCGYRVNELPNSIGDMSHLRYLNISNTCITQLPEYVCKLYNLQTLLLRNCRELNQLPTNIGNLTNLRHLDIGDTPDLKLMPTGIGKLRSLCTLSKIVIGEKNGFQLTELKGLSYLEGTLSMFGMQNIESEKEAREANLLGKGGIRKLEMKWDDSMGVCQDEDTERRVLDELKPQAGLERLLLEYYGGTSFPSWVGDPSFSCMVHLTLRGCKKCTSLPSLGHLLSLKELFIEGMEGVKVVGAEFYGNGGGFPSLETLCFADMISWEEWSMNSSIRGQESGEAVFPRLGKLSLVGCGKLMTVCLSRFPSLGVVTMKQCSEALVRIMVDLASVETLEIEGITGLTMLDEGITSSLGTLEILRVSGCQELRYLWEEKVSCVILTKLIELDIKNCNKLISLEDKEHVLPHNLERLRLSFCNSLEMMPSCSKSLRYIYISSCNKLNYYKSRKQQVPNNEGNKVIATTESWDNHDEIEEDEEGGFPNLESLNLSYCPKMKWLPTGKKQLPSTLKHLYIGECYNLAEPEEENWQLNSGSSSSNISSSLEDIYIKGWAKLKQLREGYMFGFIHLTSLGINNCEGIESIPERCLPPCLRRLIIWDCKNLKSLTLHGNNVECLEHLYIRNCKNLEFDPPFGGGGWPRNIKHLTMGEVKQPITEWGQHLNYLPPSLISLNLIGDFPEMVSLSDVGIRLPSSLTSLSLSDNVNLKSLSDISLQNLTSFENLFINNCRKLGSLPEMLPPTLSSIYICICPLLSERYRRKEKGDYWPLLSHIPRVSIEFELQ